MELVKTLFRYYLMIIAIFFIGRLGLFLWQFDRFAHSGVNYYLTFLYGLRMDTIAASYLLIIPLLLLTLTPTFLGRYVAKFLRVYFGAVFVLLIFVEVATFPFFAQYDVRPNYKFVEYLIYPKEVFGMIIAEYKLPLFIAFFLIALFLYFYKRYSRGDFIAILQKPFIKRFPLFLPLALVLFIGIRSSFGHRPANNSDAMYSSNRIINEITKNSPYSIGYAIYANRKFSAKVAKMYGKMDINEALLRIQKALAISGNNLKSASPFARKEPTHFPTQKKKNLVIFLQESLGYQFISQKLTPNLEKLKKEGLWFEELYSNGTRSIRGIAGIVSGIFSIPGKGVVKRNKSQHNFWTFSKLLKPLGYHTIFIYGGEAHFDNMRGWFLGNGFDEVIEQKDYKNPKFVGNWGVSDEDLVLMANKKFNELYKKKKPFAAIMFSSSNHTPFDIPPNTIKEVKPGVKCVENAIKYADYAIGKFFELAKKSPYYKDTVFVVVADHNVRVYGNDVVPVKMFHIPALIIADGLKAQVYKKEASQPDVLATALDLLGKDFTYPILGKSIFSKQKKGINLMQFNNTYALKVGKKVAVIEPYKKPQCYLYKNFKLHKTSHDKELERDLLAFITGLNYLYTKEKYK